MPAPAPDSGDGGSAAAIQTGIDWHTLDDWRYQEESHAVATLLATTPLSLTERTAVVAAAAELVRKVRAGGDDPGLVEAFLRQYPLNSDAGLALMSLAEALLRIPDGVTRGRLISEKILSADWTYRSPRTSHLLVKLSSACLAFAAWLSRPVRGPRWPTTRLREGAAGAAKPAIRLSMSMAVQLVGAQFVYNATIERALARARRERTLCSFDMLGEGARTEADATGYEDLYAHAITTVGTAATGSEAGRGHGISVKLSALCPRYETVQERTVWKSLFPRLRRLALLAARYQLSLTVDAEESQRLVLSMVLVESLATDPSLSQWQGLGVVVQAYQKRATHVIGLLTQLAHVSGRRILVRLVKGAYWDTEIRLAQTAGRADFPVYTTKAATDLSYLVCAQRLIAAAPALYPQFATHNAHTLVAVRHMAAEAGVEIECQRLHGMGGALHEAAARLNGSFPLRVYAPVGSHEKLLPYLVRRLLENGANNSFVSALYDERIPVETIVQDPITRVQSHPDRHPLIARPAALQCPERIVPLGRDYSVKAERENISRVLQQLDATPVESGPIVCGQLRAAPERRSVMNPAARDQLVGFVTESVGTDLDAAIVAARKAQPRWNSLGGAGRAPFLLAMSDALEKNLDHLVALLARESGKTLDDGVAEVREAIDFCRYYAQLASAQFSAPETLRGPTGETNQLTLAGRGVFACISPWNFPLAIFTGQIAASLAAGNAAIAKPAEQTPLVAAAAVRLFLTTAIDPGLLALLPGDGEVVGGALVAHPGIDGVAFTGGSDTALAINRALAARSGKIVPLIAETGGLNAMFVDTTALREQVVDDVITSAIRSAGQRCSALRMLFVPEERADELLEAIAGALATLHLGDPADPATDVGPVIDAAAMKALEQHAERLERETRVVARLLPDKLLNGSFFAPMIAEVPRADYLEREIFGPILHVFRYRESELDAVASRFAARGFGLTLGIHSRRQEFADRIRALIPAGNCYVNRAMTGAVVGVQPFGGEGLSGTGPKAGGPYSLLRYATERTVSINIAAQGGDPTLLDIGS